MGSEKRCKDGTNIDNPGWFQCYTEEQACDWKADCSDESDQLGCEPFQCPKGYFKCKDG